MQVVGSNIANRTVCIGHVVSAVCSCMWVVGSNIVIGVYVLDMWSVLFVCVCE